MTSNPNLQRDYESALKLKEEGNEAFKNGDNKGALRCYSRIFMHLGMNACVNVNAGKEKKVEDKDKEKQENANDSGEKKNETETNKEKEAEKPKEKEAPKRDPLELKCDELRITAFNNMAAVYAKMNNWDECKEKCTEVLKHDENNVKALFRRAKAYRTMGLYKLALSDLVRLQELVGEHDKAVKVEMNLLVRDERNSDDLFLGKMKKAMKAAKNKARKKEEEEERQQPQSQSQTNDNPSSSHEEKANEEQEKTSTNSTENASTTATAASTDTTATTEPEKQQ